MKVVSNHHQIGLPYLVEKLIERKIYKLEQMLHRFSPETLVLDAELSQAGQAGGYELRLTLRLPGAELTARQRGETIIAVWGEAFRTLFKSVEELKAALRSEADSARLRSQAATTARPRSAHELLVEFFKKSYPRFYNYALREIRFRCYQGFARLGYMTLRDILDEALAQVADRLAQGFDEGLARRLIYDEIRKAIVRQLRPGGLGMVPIEETIEPQDIDTDYQEFYQADEVLKVEDIVIDERAEIPEHRVEYAEIEAYIDRLLAQLPADWREAFILVEREGLSMADVARSREISEDAVGQNIQLAKRFLAEKLIDAGFEWRGLQPATSRGQEDVGHEKLLSHPGDSA